MAAGSSAISIGGAVGKGYAEKVKSKSPTVMARNTSYKNQQNPNYRIIECIIPLK